jgi:hypothetical protein
MEGIEVAATRSLPATKLPQTGGTARACGQVLPLPHLTPPTPPCR